MSILCCGRRLGTCELELDGLFHQPRKRLEMAGGRPEFQLGIPSAVKLNHHLRGFFMDFESRNRLSVAAVQAFRDPKDGRERPYRPA